jgi:endonuclease/exonuclease/phosphatase family metal-dependent hydrolase
MTLERHVARKAIRVATLNLHNRHDRWRERRHLVVAQILDAAPDVVSLQELNMPRGQGRWLCGQINTRLSGSPRRPYRILQKRNHHLIRGYFEGIGILTRLAVISTDYVDLGYEGRVALRANLVLPTGETLDFVSTHLHHVAHDREARLEQVMILTGWMNETGRVPLQVIAGDFNEVPDGPAMRQMRQMYRSAYAVTHGRDPLATFPTALVSRTDGWAGCLDYIFVSSGIDVLDTRLFADRGTENATLYPSDHVGLLAILGVAERRQVRQQSSARV